MRLGLFGGTFDPVHLGHLFLAERCREECRLDQVWFLPAGTPPHKASESITPGNQRAEILEFAIAGHPQFLGEPDGVGPRGAELHGRHAAAASDRRSVAGTFLPYRCRFAGRSAAVAGSAGNCRAGDDRRRQPGRPALPDLEALREKLGDAVFARIQLVTMPGIDLSATDIRSRVRDGKSIRYMTPRACEVYIEQHKLYRA